MSNLDLKALFSEKAEIFKAECGALLFNLGKTHIWLDSWNKNKDNCFSFDKDSFKRAFGYSFDKYYQTYYKSKKGGTSPFDIDLESVNPKLKEFFEKTTLDLSFLSGSVTTLRDIIICSGAAKKKRNPLSNMMLEGCEQINSGIDKGFPIEQLNKLWLSNAVGTYKEDINSINFDLSRINFFKKLWQDILSTLDLDNLTRRNWVEIKNYIFAEIRTWYSHLLSDSRFPVNDVILWEQAYMTASLFKAAIAALILDNNLYDKYTISGDIRWSILGIQYDKLSLINKSVKASFISWYRNTINKCDEDIKKLIEEKYAFGNEIYRDETGIYFIVPENLADDNNKVNKFYKLSKQLSDVRNDILESFQLKFSDEIYPAILLTKPSRGIMNLTSLIEEATDNYLKPELPKNFGKAKTVSGINSPIGICQICGIRPGAKDRELILCSPCLNAKTHRMEEWLENSDSETIWTGDLQDSNGRIALVSVKFELDEWLNGNMLNTMLINNPIFSEEIAKIKKILQTVIEIKRIKGDELDQYEMRLGSKKDCNGLINYIRKIDSILKESSKTIEETFYMNYNNKTFRIKENDKEKSLEEITEKPNFINYIKIFDFYVFASLAEEAYKGCRRRGENIDDFLFQILFEPSIGDKWEEFIINNLSNNNLINFKERQIIWEGLTDNDLDFLSTILLQFMIRKNPSPPRLRRIADMTLDYFSKIKKDLLHLMFGDNNYEKNWRTKRLVWYSNNMPKGEYEYNGLNFICDDSKSIYLISSIERAISVINEDRTSKNIENIHKKIIDNDTSWIKQEINGLRKIDGSLGSKTYTLNRNTVRYERYLPYISITTPTPSLWQFIIPAKYLPNVIMEIQKYYVNDFKYIFGKLPLHVGVIIQNYKKPLYVGLSALRKISRKLGNLDAIKTPITAKEFVSLTKDNFSYINTTEENEGVEKLQNVYSLYEVCGSNNTGKYQFYVTPKDKVWIDTIYDKQSNQNVLKFFIYPNTIDFEFLDVNARKNDIVYKQNGSRLEPKSNRPYTWQEWKSFKNFYDYFSKDVLSPKIHTTVCLICSKMEDWKNHEEALKKYILTSFKNIFDLSSEESLKQFANIFNIKSWNELENLDTSNFAKLLKMFIDMYEFWHQALKMI